MRNHLPGDSGRLSVSDFGGFDMSTDFPMPAASGAFAGAAATPTSTRARGRGSRGGRGMFTFLYIAFNRTQCGIFARGVKGFYTMIISWGHFLIKASWTTREHFSFRPCFA